MDNANIKHLSKFIQKPREGMSALQPLLQEYKIGLQRFQDSYKRAIERNNGTEVRPPLANILIYHATMLRGSLCLTDGCSQGLRLNPYMDLDMRDCCGAIIEDEGRCEEDEIRWDLASFDLTRPARSWLWPSHDCHFELVQQDIIVFTRAEESEGAAFSQGLVFLLKISVQSKSGKLRGAEVHLSIDESEASEFLDVAMPPKGVEFVAAHEVGGIIEFKEAPLWEGLFVEHQTFGAMSCGMLGSKQAFVKLYPDQGTQEVSYLSSIVLVCLPASDSVSYDMSVSVEASLSHAGFLKVWGKSNHMRRLGNKKVQLSTYPWWL